MKATNQLKYQKVYVGYWQQGVYPYLKPTDILLDAKEQKESIKWFDDTDYLSRNVLEEEQKAFFSIGLDDLAFLVETKEGSEDLGYPKTIAASKLQNFIKEGILDTESTWEWVYSGFTEYTQECTHVSIYLFLYNDTSKYIWLKPNQKPLYRLRKCKLNKLEAICGRFLSLVSTKLHKWDYKTSKFFNNKMVVLLEWLCLWIGTIALYNHYLGAAPVILTSLSEASFFMIFLVMLSCLKIITYPSSLFLYRYNEPIKRLKEALILLCSAIIISLGSMPLDKDFAASVLMMTVLAIFLIIIVIHISQDSLFSKSVTKTNETENSSL